jgi:hypothetical protein
MPQLPAAILDGKRENDVVAVRTEGGDLERRSESARVRLGLGDAGRVVGTSGDVACARVEHLVKNVAGDDRIHVAREAVCVDLKTSRTALRVDLPPPGRFVPRRELMFAAGLLAFAQPTDHGLEIKTWRVE